MPCRYLAFILLTTVTAVSSSQLAAETVVDFEGVDLGDSGVFNGPTANAVEITRTTPFGDTDLEDGTFNANGVEFSNSYNPAFGSWSGFAVSNQTDSTTPGFGNQYSAFPGEGAGGSSQYAVAFGNQALEPTSVIGEEFVFDPMDVQRLAELPSIYLPERTTAINAQVTNTTYAALTMQDGLVTSFGNTEPFGGPSGTDPDFFKLSVFGVGSDGQALGTEVEFFLSDYRSEDDYIIGDWQELDLTPLAGARSLHFNLSSSDVGDFGMNTPAYFALDDLTLAATAIPEPSGVLALLVITSGLVLRRRRSVNP